jgi:small subunit ribosomal protein S17
MARTLTGIVVSDKMMKTAVVAVSFTRKHPKYLKYYTVTNRFKAHNENNEYKMGDTVTISETRPLSKEKRWNIVGLVKKAAKIEA